MNPIKCIPLQPSCTENWSAGAEQYAVHLTYDLSDFLSSWPDAVPSVAFERADGRKYAHAFELKGNMLHIPLLLADTQFPGICKCMITLNSGDGQANTVVFFGSVREGIDTLDEEPAAPEKGIIEQVNAAAARAEAAAGLVPGGSAGGSSGILFVHVSAEDIEHPTADKTYADIENAIHAGQMVYVIIDTVYYVPLIGISEGTVIFSMVANIFDAITTCTVIMMADGSIVVSTT